MKKILFLFAVAALVFSGCKKDDEKPSYSGNFSINGSTYNVSNMMWFDITVQIGESSTTAYSISGADGTESNVLSLQLSNNTTGEKTIAEGTSVELVIGNDTYIATSGKISVTKFDTSTASGTFDCKFVKVGSETEIVGTGKFNAKKLSL